MGVVVVIPEFGQQKQNARNNQSNLDGSANHRSIEPTTAIFGGNMWSTIIYHTFRQLGLEWLIEAFENFVQRVRRQKQHHAADRRDAQRNDT